nr:hypothetical protein [Tanacetum cinerariifolium]
MSSTSMSSVEQATSEAGVVVTKEWRRSGYIVVLKARPSGVDSNQRLKFLDRMRLEDMQKGTRLLLMMKKTGMKIGKKIVFVTSLGDDVEVMCGSKTMCRSMVELAHATGLDVTKDQLVVLFEREIAESVQKITKFHRSCDDTLGTIAMLRTIQLDDTENVARLFSMARETQRKDVRRRLSKLYAMIREMEPIDHRRDVLDTMASLRGAVRGEDDKLASLLELVNIVVDGIREKEGYVDMMDLCD